MMEVSQHRDSMRLQNLDVMDMIPSYRKHMKDAVRVWDQPVSEGDWARVFSELRPNFVSTKVALWQSCTCLPSEVSFVSPHSGWRAW